MSKKRFYWLKLHENFFKIDSIMYLEELENGYECINFLLKVCLNNLNSDGKLIRKIGKKNIAHSTESLSKQTGTDLEKTKELLNILIEVGLIEVLEGDVMFIPILKDSVGSESDSAKRMRNKRKRDKQLKEENSSINNKDKDKEIEKDIDIEVTSQCDTLTKSHFGNYGNVLLSSGEYSKLLEEHGKHKLELCIKLLDEKIDTMGYKYNNHFVIINDWVIEEVNKRIKEGKYPKEEKDIKEIIEENKRLYPELYLED